MNTATNVSTGKPAVAGAIYVEASSTAALPTSADGTITGFTSLGFVSEDGLVNANTFESTPIKDWSGSTVLTIDGNFVDDFRFTLIEALNVDVLKEIYGADNVTGTLSTGITVNAKAAQHASKKWIVDMIMRDGALKRICLPNAAISRVGEISYANNSAVGYAVTLTAMPDTSGNTHYEYIKRA